MSKLRLDQGQIDAARGAAAQIARAVHAEAMTRTTVAVERATLRLFGLDGVDEEDVPLPNRVVNDLLERGLAGLGDLVLTCSSDMSRNHTVGYELGRGRRLDDIQKEIGQVAEGVLNARSTRALARKLGVEMPLSEMVYRVLYEGQAPREAVGGLMTRETKSEN